MNKPLSGLLLYRRIMPTAERLFSKFHSCPRSFQPWALSSDIPAAERDLCTKYTHALPCIAMYAHVLPRNTIYYHLLKTEPRISDFQHFHWFAGPELVMAGHRLSIHIPAVPNMVKIAN